VSDTDYLFCVTDRMLPVSLSRHLIGPCKNGPKSFIFQKERETENKIIWRSVEYTKQKNCRRLHSTGKVYFKTTNPYHFPDIGQIKAKEVMKN